MHRRHHVERPWVSRQTRFVELHCSDVFSMVTVLPIVYSMNQEWHLSDYSRLLITVSMETVLNADSSMLEYVRIEEDWHWRINKRDLFVVESMLVENAIELLEKCQLNEVMMLVESPFSLREW